MPLPLARAALAGAAAAFLLAGSAAAQRIGQWERLGSREVNLSRDRDSISVGRSDGTFRQIKLNVKHNAVTVERLTVVYANGGDDRIPMGYVIRPATDSRVIDLRGRDRYIRRVDMVLKSVPNGRGKAVVELWGRR